MTSPPEQADFIVVGAGSAGCVLANRLSADPGTRVLLLEAGGRDDNFWIQVPLGYFQNVYNEKLTWRFETEPVPGLGGRKMVWPRGRVLGGSSAINGLIWIRGQPADYDHWRQLGNAGWSWADVLPYFRKAEGFEGVEAGPYGADGPMTVSAADRPHVLHDAFFAAAREAGFPANANFNGETQEGVGTYQLTVAKGRRRSGAAAYLKPVMHRPNLRIETGALVRKVLFEGTRAVGVEYVRDGTVKIVRCAREIILSGGTINSPQVLQLSGVGDPEHLRDVGIEPLHALKGVGENLQDHLNARIVARCKDPVSINAIRRSRLRSLAVGLRWMLTRGGILAGGPMTAGMFAKTLPQLETPDIQFHFFAGSADRAGASMHDFPGCTISCVPCRPESRGWIKIGSPDPAVHPAIQPNYLSTQADMDCVVRGLRIIRRLYATDAMRAVTVEEMIPGGAAVSDADLEGYVRERVGTAFHAVGTCRMGEDPLAVVDARLSVVGLQGVRVVDASVMPSIISGNTNAPTIMIAEKASDMILERPA